jgi:hypothetical protein
MFPQPNTDEKAGNGRTLVMHQRNPRIFRRAMILVLLITQAYVAITLSKSIYIFQSFQSKDPRTSPPPPEPEKVEVVELPLPPVAPSNERGSCTLEINARGTGCIPRELNDANFQAGDFTPDGNHVIVTVKFVGALEASNYKGEQLVLVKTDESTFNSGDAWKCLTCGASSQYKDMSVDYPHVFRSGRKALWGRKYVLISTAALYAITLT